MKKLKSLIIILIAGSAILLIGCENQLEPADEPSTFSEIIEVEGTLHLFSPSLLNEAGSRIQFQANGEIDARDMEGVEIQHSHNALLNGDMVKIMKGEFHAYGTEDNSFYGIYEGDGRQNEDGLTATLRLQIEGGSGTYTGASGYVTEEIHLEDGATGGIIYRIDLGGYILPGGRISPEK